MENNSSPHKKPWYAPLAHFAAHSIIGSGIFVIVATPAVALGWLVHTLKEYHVDEFTISVLSVLERTILMVDCALFLSHLAFTALSAFKEMKDGE
ncbi:hypothetical protein OU5_P0021 (plasmid) [Pseudomonas mandelii JR-1]|jgi:hypothetical protein|uniref:Uncharacterized protein n=2 Tax=Pseudomonas TaxID=286 RepID=A0A024ELL4_9PSED|nr:MULTISPECIES: hypothetical protein [Pseudomonas]AHZ73273.1 hypothetical protein OU5_P0021 [Pseudomonas mandelii JR-1]KRP82425.1 hypothetical protein TX25_29505 [Pseudomonas lactis]MBC2384592.1 hypothetical protein [Pseudomonas cremoris]MBJ2182595.1 hypothetical protein [Pseudomonas veronii]MBV7514483.1 hypothetical protein [Pseudomonas sp. PDM25]